LSYSVNFLSTSGASLKPIQITDLVYPASSYSVNFLSTSGASLQPGSSQGVFSSSTTGYSPQFISTISAFLLPKDISGTLVADAFSFSTGGGGGGGPSTPTSGQIWPPGLS
jgi:hypothetical protein